VQKNPAAFAQIEAVTQEEIGCRDGNQKSRHDFVEAGGEEHQGKQQQVAPRGCRADMEVDRDIEGRQRRGEDFRFFDAREIPDAERACVDDAEQRDIFALDQRGKRAQRRPYAERTDQRKERAMQMRGFQPCRERGNHLQPCQRKRNRERVQAEIAIADFAIRQRRKIQRVGAELHPAVAERRIENEGRRPIDREGADADERQRERMDREQRPA